MKKFENFLEGYFLALCGVAMTTICGLLVIALFCAGRLVFFGNCGGCLG